MLSSLFYALIDASLLLRKLIETQPSFNQDEDVWKDNKFAVEW